MVVEKKVILELHDICSIEVELSHNGICGGNHSHGGFVNIKMKNIFGAAYLTSNGEEVDIIEFGVKGDSERELLIQSFKEIIKILENE